MYRLYRLKTPTDSSTLWLDYQWKDTFQNTEWRPCVEHFLNEVTALGHTVVALPAPDFRCGEDYVEIAYLVDGNKTAFSSDLLLSLIVIEPDDPQLIRRIWADIGKKVGWVGG